MPTDISTRPEQNPNRYRNFGLQMAVFVSLLFGVFLPWIFDKSTALWPWIISLILVVIALVIPTALKPLYEGFYRVAYWLQIFNTRLLMTLVWLLMILPIGLMMRIFQRSRIDIRFQSNLGSNRRLRNQSIKPIDMQKPF
mgnify:CR=1 FL=1